MIRSIHVHLLPSLFEPSEVRGGVAVIVDILRASTTIIHALANDAAGVVPCGTVDEAFAVRESFAADTCLLGGERGGIRIDGFDLSNSPDDYAKSVVQGKTIGFTTTNGTKALLCSDQAEEILIGAFVNFSAVLQRLAAQSKPIHIVCAGTDGVITGEDVLFAGALITALNNGDSDFEIDDAGVIAANHWRQECCELSSLKIEPALRRAQGGRNLIRLGYDKDIGTASMVDSVPVVGFVDDDRVIRRCEIVT
jgi:2-phosphosulfolactate phosphatase